MNTSRNVHARKVTGLTFGRDFGVWLRRPHKVLPSLDIPESLRKLKRGQMRGKFVFEKPGSS
jgi:hypothetical protein